METCNLENEKMYETWRRDREEGEWDGNWNAEEIEGRGNRQLLWKARWSCFQATLKGILAHIGHLLRPNMVVFSLKDDSRSSPSGFDDLIPP